MATPATLPPPSAVHEKLKKASPGMAGMVIFGLMLIGGVIYIAMQLWGCLLYTSRCV